MNQKKAGNRYELIIRELFRSLGWVKCRTSREESKMLDDMGVDLTHTDPFNIQCKRWRSAPSYHKVLKAMPDDENYNIIFHRRPYQGDVVVMESESFIELIKMMKSEGIL